MAERPDQRERTRSHLSWLTTASLAGAIGLIGLLMMAGRVANADRSQPLVPDGSPEIRRESSTPFLFDRTRNTRAIAGFGGPVLDVSIGAIVISTDFDGRITAVELDSGIVTRTSIRTGAFVTVDGQLVIQTGCGAWQTVEIPEYTLGDHLIGCGSYQPIRRRGADVAFFAGAGADGVRDVVIADGLGGVRPATQADVALWPHATLTDGEPSDYADGRLIEAGPGGVLWADCETTANCDVWFGTPQQARVNRFVIDSNDGEFLARINDHGSRAVFFLEDEILRIITLETGHAREVENPGIRWSTATWSPDGLWLLDPMGTDVVALNTLNGRTVRFAGVPGDASPGWVALVEARVPGR